MSPFLAVSDGVWTGLIVAVTGLAMAGTQVLTAWMASKKVEAVKTALENTTVSTDKKLSAIASTGEKTHTLVNSAMGYQLKLGAELSRWKADREPTEENKIAAEKAEQSYLEHQGNQSRVDSNTKTL